MKTDTSDVDLTGSDVDVPTNTIFELLLDVRRRYVLYHLQDSSETVTVDRLADRIVRWEGSYDPNDRDRVRMELHHRHLPAFVDARVVRYDPVAGTVGRLPAADRLEAYLDLSRTADL